MKEDSQELAVLERSAVAPVVSASNSTALLQAIASAASNPQTDIEKMERLFAMHEKMVAREAEGAFNMSLSLAQQKIVPVVKNRKNTHTSSNYADLAAVMESITPIYTAEGLSLSYDSEAIADHPNWIRIVAILSHSSGHSRRYTLDLPFDDAGAKGTSNKTQVQAAVSSSSYGRRVLGCMIFNVATVENDGNAQKKKQEQTADPEGKKALEACASIDSLKKAWAALTPKQRETLEDVKNKCRETINKADKDAA